MNYFATLFTVLCFFTRHLLADEFTNPSNSQADLSQHYVIGQVVQVEWQTSLSEITLLVSHWGGEAVGALLSDAANPGVYSWTIGQGDNIDASMVATSANYVLVISDPTGANETGNGFIDGQLQSRAFIIEADTAAASTTASSSTQSVSTSTAPTSSSTGTFSSSQTSTSVIGQSTSSATVAPAESGMGTGEKAGIGAGAGIGALILIGAGAGIAIWATKRRKNNNGNSNGNTVEAGLYPLQSPPPPPPPPPPFEDKKDAYEVHNKSSAYEMPYNSPPLNEMDGNWQKPQMQTSTAIHELESGTNARRK